jgi:hypothetical protein
MSRPPADYPGPSPVDMDAAGRSMHEERLVQLSVPLPMPAAALLQLGP